MINFITTKNRLFVIYYEDDQRYIIHKRKQKQKEKYVSVDDEYKAPTTAGAV